MIITLIRHHQLMSDIVGAGIKKHTLFHLQYLGIKIPAQRRLCGNWRELFDFGYFGHGWGKLYDEKF